MNKRTERKKLIAKCQALKREKDNLYDEYDALRRQTDAAHDAFRAAQREVEDAREAVRVNERCLRSVSSSSLPGTSRLFQAQVSQSRDRLAKSKEQMEAAKAKFKYLLTARNEIKQKLESAQARYGDASTELSSLNTERKPDKNPDGIIRQVNMRLVNGNPEYLKNVFGANAEIVFSMKKPKKIDVFFGPRDDRGHAVINSGGNVSYPDGGRIACTIDTSTALRVRSLPKNNA